VDVAAAGSSEVKESAKEELKAEAVGEGAEE